MSKLTNRRKGDHVRICVKEDVGYSHNYFDDIDFVHGALTELNYDDLDTGVRFINHTLKHPFMITAITGGYPEAEKINKAFAKMCEKHGLAFGLGSQRAMLEDPALKSTYCVRDIAPTIPIVGNIGAAQLFNYDYARINGMLKDIEADYLAVHLNTLQELIQPEGDRKFAGLREKINGLYRSIDFPVIIKETGAGITGRIASRIIGWGSGVKGIDVAGRGGTSWSKVEGLRGGRVGPFAEWGVPTPVCIAEVAHMGIFTIGSGGVRNGLDAAKSIALGADIVGAARPFIKAYYSGNLEGLISEWIDDLKRAMLLTNCQNVSELFSKNIIITGKTSEYMRARGVDPARFGNRRK